MTENKVQFNLKNVHYALLTETITEGTVGYSWAVPVRVPGAVNLSLEEALDLGWEILADCFEKDETGIKSDLTDEFWPSK